MKIKRQIYKYAIGENQKLELEENRQSYWYIIMEADELHRPVFSPNKRYYAYASGLREIYLHDMANKDERLLVKDCAARVDFKSSHLPEIPICWLDDSTVLTQRDNGEIIAVNLEGVVVGQLSFGAPKAPKDNPCFYTLADGTILYYCEDFYVIDMDKKVAREWDWKSLGYGFEMDISMDPYNRYQKIKYYGEIIGVLPCSSLNYAATDGFLALDLWPYDSFKRGLAIWNSITGKWINLEIAQLEGILGWRVADEQE